MPSPTVPHPGQSESDVLDVRAAIWSQKPLLREIYHRYFHEMVSHLANTPSSQLPQATGLRTQDSGLKTQDSFGTILEVGGGSGNFREFFHNHYPNTPPLTTLIASDIVPTPHCDLACDAAQLPFPDNSLDNIVLQDVLHHIPYPLAFFAEAQRTLRPHGRLIMTEPYISPASRVIFKLAHPEPVNLRAQLFPLPSSSTIDPPGFTGSGAFASNQAVPTLLFFRDFPRFQQRFPHLRLLLRARRSFLVYPLSGGFSGPQLLPNFALPLAWALESLLQPLAPLLAFRLVVVLEKNEPRPP